MALAERTAATSTRRPLVAILPLLSLAAIATGMTVLLVVKGTWLDEYWTRWMTAPHVALGDLLSERMMRDPGHPPTFPLIAWAFEPLTGAAIVAKRWLNVVPLLLLLAPTLASLRRETAANLYRPMLLLALATMPLIVAKFAEHRAYFFDVVAVTAALLLAREVTLRHLLNASISRGLLAWWVFVTFFATILDYTAAIPMACALGCFALYHLVAGRASLAWLAAATIAVALTVLVINIYLGAQGRSGSTGSPYQVSLITGLATIAVVLGSGLLLNLPLAIGAAGAVRRVPNDAVTRARVRWAAIVAAGLIATGLAFAAVQVVTEAVIPRQLTPALALPALLIAELATLRPIRPVIIVGACAFALAVTVATVVHEARDAGWETVMPSLAAARGACPDTRIIALPPHLLLPPDSPTFVGEKEAIEESYRGVAAIHHLPIQFVDGQRSFDVRSARCPTIVWIEHNWRGQGATAVDIIAAAHIVATPQQIAKAALARHATVASETLTLPAGR